MLPETNGHDAAPFRRQGLGYVWTITGFGGIRLHVDRLHTRGEYLSAEVALEDPEGQWIFDDRVSLNSASARKKFVLALVERTKDGLHVERWMEEMELCSAAVRHAHRKGAPFIEIGGGSAPPVYELEWQVGPLVPRNMPTILYGQWSAGKSMLAVGIAVSVAAGRAFAGHPVRAGRVVYCDHEVTQDVFTRRVWGVSRGLGLDRPPSGIYYQRARGKLVDHCEALADVVAERKIDLVIVDSVSMAAGSAGERGTYEEVALGLYTALECLPEVTVLLLDHVSGEGRRTEKLAGKAFGSELKMAGARMAWEARKEQVTEARTMVLMLYNTKPFSEAAAQQPQGFRVVFDEGGHAVRIAPVSITEAGGNLEARQPQHERMRQLLVAEGPKSVKEISEELDLRPEAVRSLGSRWSGELFTKLADGRWAVQEEGTAEDGSETEEVPF